MKRLLSTIEVAKLSDGHITGVDIDEKALNKLRKKVEELGLGDRIKIHNMSMSNLEFPPETFDVIWAEGSIWFMGFEKGRIRHSSPHCGEIITLSTADLGIKNTQ